MAERLTDRGIAALKAADADQYYFDSEVSGLAVRVYPTGSKVFVFDWRDNGRQRRATIGRFPAWTIGKARTHAGKMRLKADVGEIVTPGRGGRVADLIEEWKETVKVTRRPSTAKSYLRLIDSHIVPAFGKGEPKGITRNAIELWHGEIAKRTSTEANRAIAVLSAFLSWLEHDKKIDRNPAKGVRRRPENQRHVFLDADEITAAHAALDADDTRNAALALRLALLTGCRIGEVLLLEPSQIDAKRKLWIKPAASTKQKKLHIVPLQAEALAIAKELLHIGLPDYDGCRRAWLRVRTIIGREDIRVHDLRHSRASALARGGASLPQIGRVLGHTAPGTTQRYAHLVATDLADLVERS
ncbi:site-specific integrase [Bradyrhizobium sp. JYMT SZCCT0428]|uniref:tyrosine-type recombinase/integrase n=1 Tax=Bradyrhizobium sp. JYMT SZCCT0428 TaxID=2807673 RepID=UPI001BA64230|nr:tyrosine-type recombinase/integrase [Bradyrhizobium sp. JYMT SZCCT0428]MBR1153567.1 tyrosine-type recombinase/integrase [Bradyrhizobium sp. JYMT SZCCT0428]